MCVKYVTLPHTHNHPPSTHPLLTHTLSLIHIHSYTFTHTLTLIHPSPSHHTSFPNLKEKRKRERKRERKKEKKKKKKREKERKKGGEKEEKIAFFDAPLEWIWLILGVQIHLMEYYLLEKIPVKRALFRTRIYIYMFRKSALDMSYVNTMGGR